MIKRMPLEEMRVRVENLKKLFGEEYVDNIVAYFKSQAEHEIDVLYLAFFHIRRTRLRYSPNTYGEYTEVTFQRKTFKWVYANSPYYTVNNVYADYSSYNGMSYTYTTYATI